MKDELPAFSELLQPVIDALKALGGSATPKEVFEHLVKKMEISYTDLEIRSE